MGKKSMKLSAAISMGVGAMVGAGIFALMGEAGARAGNAVFVSFAVSAFFVQTFLKVDYIWSVIAAVFLTPFNITIYVKRDVLQYLVGHHPAVFFSNAVISILPVQMVAFGTLGAVAGYWLGVRYNLWQKDQE